MKLPVCRQRTLTYMAMVQYAVVLTSTPVRCQLARRQLTFLVDLLASYICSNVQALRFTISKFVSRHPGLTLYGKRTMVGTSSRLCNELTAPLIYHGVQTMPASLRALRARAFGICLGVAATALIPTTTAGVDPLWLRYTPLPHAAAEIQRVVVAASKEICSDEASTLKAVAEELEAGLLVGIQLAPPCTIANAKHIFAVSVSGTCPVPQTTGLWH